MALRQTKKISELPALSPASLDTTFVVGISGSTTYKISINNLTSSLDTTFATDLVTNALSSSLNGKLSTSSFNSYTASISTGSLVTSISNLNTFTASVTTASIVTSISNLNTFTASVSTASLVTSISNLNTFTASQSTSSLVNRLNAIENVSGSWITESETGSFLTSLNGAISSSAQITAFGFVSGSYETTGRGIISSSLQTTDWGYTTTASFNSFTSSQFNTLSASVASVQTNLNQVTASLGSTSNAFSFIGVINPTNLTLVSYATASYNGGVIDILAVNNTNSTATSTNYQFASFGVNAGISQNGKQTSGAGAPNLAPTIAVSGSNIVIQVTLTGTFNIKGVARLF